MATLPAFAGLPQERARTNLYDQAALAPPVRLCVCISSAILFPPLSQGQGVTPAARIINPIDESQLVRLSGNTNPRANAKNDLGPVSADFALPDLTLVLSRSAEQQAAFDAFVARQYNQSSPNYHQWLTPEQIGAQYGPAQADIATITGWLTGHGFTVKRVTPDCMTIRFSGTAAQVQSAFHTQIHSLSVNGVGALREYERPADSRGSGARDRGRQGAA